MDEEQQRGVLTIAGIVLAFFALIFGGVWSASYETMKTRERIFIECTKDHPLDACAYISDSISGR